jgi:hypothetical protein
VPPLPELPSFASAPAVPLVPPDPVEPLLPLVLVPAAPLLPADPAAPLLPPRPDVPPLPAALSGSSSSPHAVIPKSVTTAVEMKSSRIPISLDIVRTLLASDRRAPPAISTYRARAERDALPSQARISRPKFSNQPSVELCGALSERLDAVRKAGCCPDFRTLD